MTESRPSHQGLRAAADALAGRRFAEAVGLGESCATRYQLSRERHERAGHREAFTLEHAQAQPGSHFFDWLIASPQAVMACIERNFATVFDRDRLGIGPVGLVEHADYGLRFDHAFPLTEGRVAPATLDAEHGRQCGKYGHLAERFMAVLERDDDLLFVMSFGGGIRVVEEVAALLGRKRRGKPFHLLAIVLGEASRGCVFADRVCSVHEVGPALGKPAEFRWQGDDHAWREVFRSVRFDARLPSVIDHAAQGDRG